MNASSVRRLAKDQAALRRSTPPNYLFPDGDDLGIPDDLTQLLILITGAHGTPYSQGVWKLHLRMPQDYPANPPKATFKTRIYHPNVEENTGAVCLDTLKKDWRPELTLKDILITISCLLIHPNPDSALNSEAGALLQEDYGAFARKAKLMASIHAPIPNALKDSVDEAKRRGEDPCVGHAVEVTQRPAASRAASSSTSITMKEVSSRITNRRPSPQVLLPSEDGEVEDDTKENDLLHPPRSPSRPPPSPRKVLGKRASCDVPTPVDVDQDFPFHAEKMLLDHATHPENRETSSEPLKKSPKLAREAHSTGIAIVISDEVSKEASAADDKEDRISAPGADTISVEKAAMRQKTNVPPRPTLRKVSNAGSSKGKNLPRVGIRRL